MFKTNDDPANCEERSVIRYLKETNEQKSQLKFIINLWIYGENVMSDERVRNWARQLNNGYSEAPNGWPSVVNDGLIQKVNGKTCKSRRKAVGSLVVRALDSRPEGLGSMPVATKCPPNSHGLPAPGNRSNERRYREKDLATTEEKKVGTGEKREGDEKSRGREK
ncbi:hypothetical protein TNCV_1314541 [Trichonephila clavipes]|nr:hypothetical protein TNCV_1314541 [Trichonephila clavipes]